MKLENKTESSEDLVTPQQELSSWKAWLDRSETQALFASLRHDATVTLDTLIEQDLAGPNAIYEVLRLLGEVRAYRRASQLILGRMEQLTQLVAEQKEQGNETNETPA